MLEKIRMACEWKNLGRFAIDHFAISDGWNGGGGGAQERVESVHRHYLTAYFKASTYAATFSDNGYENNLNRSGQVLPFAEISSIMEKVLAQWDKSLICPYSDKLSWSLLNADELLAIFPWLQTSDHFEVSGQRFDIPPHVSALTWSGSPKRDDTQKRFMCVWKYCNGTSYYVPRMCVRLFSPNDPFVDWDDAPLEPYAKGDAGTKWLSIASKRGTTEEIARELMMDFLYGVVVTLNDDKDLDRNYKVTFRLDEETGKESDFGAEIAVKGTIDEVVESWDRQRILMYARKLGLAKTRDVLANCGEQLSDEALRNTIDPNLYRRRIKKTMVTRKLCQIFIKKDREEQRDDAHQDVNMNILRTILGGFIAERSTWTEAN